MASAETASHEQISVRMEGLSLLTGNNKTETVTTQYINLPILSDGSIAGIDHQNLILARTADGNTILLDASQLTVLTEPGIPLYDGTNVFHLTETHSETSEVAQVSESNENDSAKSKESVSAPLNIEDEEEILPPDKFISFKCSFCNLEFSLRRKLNRHLNIHAEEKPNRCSQCSASFNKEYNLILHEATHSTSDPTCPTCKKKFTRMASLKSHLMLHEVEENLICSDCGDEFNTQFQLDKHMQEHITDTTEVKTFTCRTCSKSFNKLSHLRDHCKIHYKIKASLHHRIYKKNIDRSSFSHKCHHCGKLFQKPSQLLRHNRIHTGERPFNCRICGKAFNQKGALLIHMIKHTGERPHTCDFCPATFAQKGNLRNHIRRVHTLLTVDGSDGVHKCDLCSCVFKKLGSLNAHMSRAHCTSGTVSQNTASENTEDVNANISHVINELIEMSKDAENSTMNQNLKRIAVDNNVNSDILQQALENSGLAPSEQSANQSNLNKPSSRSSLPASYSTASGNHLIRNVNGVKWYQCMYCSKEFKKPSDLVRHIRIHTHEKPYKCDLCYRAFAVKSTLNAHIRTHSDVKEFSCEHCKKLFSTSGSLKVHLLLHTGARPFQCSVCDRTFRTSGHKNSHMRSHMPDKAGHKRSKKPPKLISANNLKNVPDIPLQEPILITDNGYMQQPPKNSLNQMTENSNPSERPYRCTECPKAFKKSSHLKQHIRSHTGEKPYECNQCHRSFVSNGVLKSHMKTHTGIKGYNCNVCEASFTTNGSLRRHMCIHRDERPYMCPYCQKTFKTNMNCKKHMKVHRYELLLGMTSGVTVTVVSGGGVSTVYNLDNAKNAAPSATQITGEIIQNVETSTVDNNGNQSASTSYFGADADKTVAEEADVLPQIPQHLSQEIFNTQTGLSEQAEVIPQDQIQNNIFTLPSEFVDNNLTLQLENNDENNIPNSTSDPVIPNMFQVIQQEPCNETDKQATTNPDIHPEDENKDPPRKKQSKRSYKCLECNAIFKKASYLKQHMVSHLTEKHPCELCGIIFENETKLTNHIINIHPTLNLHYGCDDCGASFTTKRSLIRHSTIHDPSTPYRCSYCSKRYSTKEEYTEHLKKVHEDNTNTKTQNEEINNPALIQHVSFINQAELIPQDITVTQNTDPKHLEPEQISKKEKSEYTPKHAHHCSRCPKSFKKPSDLVRHMRIHTGEKPYSCDLCGKAFTVKSTLDSHLKTHTGEKNFQCHVCCSNFATKGSLKVHMRLHTGVRPFKCPHCEQCFRTSGHRKSHMASHFREKTLRKHKKYFFSEAVSMLGNKDDAKHPSPPPPPPEAVAVQSEPCSEIEVPVNQEDIQLQLPTLVGQNIQITTLDPSFLSKPIQIDPAFLQQLQQNININITLAPNITDQLNKVVDINQPQQILNIETNPTSVPATNSTFTLNPMVLQQLGYTLTQQPDVQVTETIPITLTDLNITKNVTSEVFQNGEILDSQILTLERNPNAEIILNTSNKIPEESLQNENSVPCYQQNNVVTNVITDTFTCQTCSKTFKTLGQLNAHQAVHKITKCIYRCEICNKNFKKKHHFSKHMQLHS